MFVYPTHGPSGHSAQATHGAVSPAILGLNRPGAEIQQCGGTTGRADMSCSLAAGGSCRLATPSSSDGVGGCLSAGGGAMIEVGQGFLIDGTANLLPVAGQASTLREAVRNATAPRR